MAIYYLFRGHDPPPARLQDVVDEEGFFEDVNVQSIDNKHRKRCEDKMHGIGPFFGQPQPAKPGDSQ